MCAIRAKNCTWHNKVEAFDPSVINPPPLTLRRRSEQLFASAQREKAHDDASAALLLFYAAECALKSIYMVQNNLRATDEARGSAVSARSYSHNLRGLIVALNIPNASVPRIPPVIIDKTGLSAEAAVLHEAWRYGVKVRDLTALYDWLTIIIEWCRKNR